MLDLQRQNTRNIACREANKTWNWAHRVDPVAFASLAVAPTGGSPLSAGTPGRFRKDTAETWQIWQRVDVKQRISRRRPFDVG